MVAPTYAATGGWQFSWGDEFTGPNVDSTVWGYEIGNIRNNEAQYYTNRIENSFIDNGTLHIRALRDNWNGHQYTSASRTTRNTKSWLYGRFEMRAQIDIRTGSWPAWWALGFDEPWPVCGEVDMMEYYQNQCLFNIMDGKRAWYSPRKSISDLGGDRWVAQFHVWTWEWDSTKMDLSLDGNLINHFLVSKADGTGRNGINPFRQPMYMIINQAIGGSMGGDPSHTDFPIDYHIDWIRVHVWKDTTSFALIVRNGTGSGPYIAGTKASITALPPSPGQVFDYWAIDQGIPVIGDSLAPSALLTMPAGKASISARYKKAVP